LFCWYVVVMLVCCCWYVVVLLVCCCYVGMLLLCWYVVVVGMLLLCWYVLSGADDRYRVRLLLHPGVQGSDYINASYLDVSGWGLGEGGVAGRGALGERMDLMWLSDRTSVLWLGRERSEAKVPIDV